MTNQKLSITPTDQSESSNPTNSITQTSHKVESLDGELKDAFADLLSLHPPDEEAKPEMNGGANGDVGSVGE